MTVEQRPRRDFALFGGDIFRVKKGVHVDNFWPIRHRFVSDLTANITTLTRISSLIKFE